MPRNLTAFTDEELEVEVKRRKEAKKGPPPVLTDINWKPVIDYVTNSVNEIASQPDKERYEPKDFEHWIFESVMESIYGKVIWTWWNKQF